MSKWGRHSGAGWATATILLTTACTTSDVADRFSHLPQDQYCDLAQGDRTWLEQALAGWRLVLRDFLKAPAPRLPEIVTYDSRCSYSLAAQSGSPPPWSIARHNGAIALPNGSTIPAGPSAFNAAGQSGNFVVMSLPSVWRPVAPRSEIPLGWFLEGVLFHELAHAYQSVVTPQLSFRYLHSVQGLPESVNDDSVQEAFRSDPAYVAEYRSELDLLFRAATAPSDREARASACDALAQLRRRRTRYFTGARSHLALTDEISLTTEGLGEWISYTWLTRGRGVAPSLVLPRFRGSFWSQEQGLAIFLVVDRLVPRWQRQLFSPSPAGAEQLLASACRR